MDLNLVKDLITAIDARPILMKLQDGGFKDHCLQFEQNCINDIKAQLEQEVVTQVANVTAPASASNILQEVESAAKPFVDQMEKEVVTAVGNFCSTI